ncbi:trypsin-like peptidase domain-containing protein [Streptomyces sp. NPDC003374]
MPVESDPGSGVPAGGQVSPSPAEEGGGASEVPAPAQGPGSPAQQGEPAAEVPAAGQVSPPAVGGDGAPAVVPESGQHPGTRQPAASEPPAVQAAPAPALGDGPREERPRPLHDPDPYSTPPYGEPGPWAPAPPVQHPAVASAAGGSVAQPPVPAHPGDCAQPPGTVRAPGPVPPVPPAQGPSPAPQDDVTASASAPVGHPAAGHAPAADPGADPATASAPASDPFAAPAPAPDPHAAAAPAALAAPAPVPDAHAAPAPAPGPHTASAPVPAPLGGAAAVPADAPPAAGPWERYDPWAASPVAAPLQQSGAGMLSPEKRRRRVRRAIAGAAVLLALASGGLGGLLGAYIERNGGVGAVELPQAGHEPAGRAPDSVAGIAARALPSVVTLHVTGSGEQGTGTGFVLDRLGHILTNNHVVEAAASSGDISVTFSGGQTAKARIVGRDSGYDLAVVQVRGVRGLTPMPLGNSDNVQVGDPVVAIGAPFDLANTVTSGIISAKERPITAGGEKGDGSDVSYVDALQTDAPINPGNSGGPLLDTRGRVVGINSAIRSADTGSDLQTGQAGSIGLGFAIPVNQAKRVAEELINTGRASHPVIGVTLDMNYTGDGAKVGAKGRNGGSPVTPGGPGAKAGIRAGDVITEVDGQRVHSGEELIVKTRAHRPGDRLRLTVRRGGIEHHVSLVLGSSHGN